MGSFRVSDHGIQNSDGDFFQLFEFQTDREYIDLCPFFRQVRGGSNFVPSQIPNYTQAAAGGTQPTRAGLLSLVSLPSALFRETHGTLKLGSSPNPNFQTLDRR